MDKEKFADRDLGGVPTPSEADRERRRRAQVQLRLAEIQKKQKRPVNRSVLVLGESIAVARAARFELGAAEQDMSMRQLERKTVLELAPPVGGLVYDQHSRALGSVGMWAILAICVVSDYLVDRGSMLVFRLPLALTESIALLIAVLQTMAAHSVGRLLRRHSEAEDPDTLRHEWRKMWLLIGFLAVVVLGVAAVRASLGSFVFALVILGAGAVSAVVATVASYLHASTRRDALEKTTREVRSSGHQVAGRGKDLLTSEAAVIAAVDSLQAAAATGVAKIELVYAANSFTPDEEPPWVKEWRAWADGRALPYPEFVPQEV